MTTPTPAQRALIDRTRAVLEADDRVLAAWLGGSFGQGTADEWSDVDVHACVADGVLAEIEADLDRIRSAILTPLMTAKLGAAGYGVVGFWAVDDAWDHVDVMFYDRAHARPETFVPLFDRAGVLPDAGEWQRPSTPWFPRDVVEGFIYVIGHHPVVAGRRETAFMQLSFGVLCQSFLLPLMYAENGDAPAGGVKRLSAFLTDEQRAELATMPAITHDHDALVDAMRWLADRFFTRARSLAARLGEEYPDALERSARAHAGL